MSPLRTASDRRRDAWAVAFALVFPTIVTSVYFILLAQQSSAWQQGAYAIGKVLQFGFPVIWVLSVQGSKPKPRWPHSWEFAEGAVLGLIIVAAMMTLYLIWLKPGGLPPDAVDSIRAKVAGMDVQSPPRFAALGTFYSIVHSLLEECYWRWFVYGQLRELAGRGTAVAVSSVGFMAHHVCVLGQFFGWTSPAGLFLTVFFSLSIAIGGAFWAAMYQRQGALYGVWLSHLLVDAGIFAIGYDLVLR